ncbi:MAG: ABC transporter substrate-binding protein [Haloferacaceae archaeon]
MSRPIVTDRRKLLKMSGAGLAASLAGCAGLGGGGGGGGGNYDEAVQELGISENWQQRRIQQAVDNWPMDKRLQVPKSGATTWTNSGAWQSAVDNNAWAPPEGWDDTAAGDVDKIQILNHGAANMQYDPATLATHELFTEQTGIEVDVLAVPAEQATTRQQQFLSSGEGKPHAFNVNGPLAPVFIEEGWLQIVDPLYPDGSVEPYIPALSSLMQWDIGPTEGSHWYGFPNITEGSLGHLRTDLISNQGLDPATFQGEWTWDDLESMMKAFEGTDVFGFGFYAGDAIYLSYSYRELLYQQGGRMVQDDGTVKVDTDASIRVVQKMHEWVDKGWVPTDVVTYGEGDLVDTFLSGQIAFATGFSDFVPQAVNKFGEAAARSTRRSSRRRRTPAPRRPRRAWSTRT